MHLLLNTRLVTKIFFSKVCGCEPRFFNTSTFLEIYFNQVKSNSILANEKNDESSSVAWCKRYKA